MKTTIPLFASVLLGLGSAACGSDVPAMPDASMHDGGGVADAGFVIDSSLDDAGSVADAGFSDAGALIDGGLLDAGWFDDAGLDGSFDAGTISDAGSIEDASVLDGGTAIDVGPFDGGFSDAGWGDGGMMTDAGSPPPPPTPIDCDTDPISSFAGVVRALVTSVPIEGAQVCVLDHPEIPCATTDSAGVYTLACAPVGEAAISFVASGFSSGIWLWNGELSVTHSLSVSLVTEEENTIYFAPTGFAYPDGASGLLTMAFAGNAAGLTARLRTGSGHGPIYTMYEGGQISPTATQLASASELAFFIAQPTPGWNEVEIELMPGPGIVCGHADGIWQARDATPNIIRMPIRTSAETVISILCQ